MYRKKKAATRTVSRSRIAANFGAAAGDIGARTGAARHLPSARTARGANKASASAPWMKMARIIPGGNLLERKAMEELAGHGRDAVHAHKESADELPAMPARPEDEVGERAADTESKNEKAAKKVF